MLSNLLKNKIGCKCLMVIAIIVEEKTPLSIGGG
jgi:hypothetical protein